MVSWVARIIRGLVYRWPGDNYPIPLLAWELSLLFIQGLTVHWAPAVLHRRNKLGSLSLWGRRKTYLCGESPKKPKGDPVDSERTSGFCQTRKSVSQNSAIPPTVSSHQNCRPRWDIDSFSPSLPAYNLKIFIILVYGCLFPQEWTKSPPAVC